MICLLNFCHKDRDQALNLLKWISQLGGCAGHELILQSNMIAAANGLVSELELAAQGSFDTVTTRVTDLQDERGWPFSCNSAWHDAVVYIRSRMLKPWLFETFEGDPKSPGWIEQAQKASARFSKGFLWMESDCVPLGPKWMDPIETHYVAVSTRKKDPKYFLGGEVMVPQHRMSGVAVYPSFVSQFTRGLVFLPNAKGPWDQLLAADFMQWVQFSPLIQNIWNRVPGDPSTAPTFPDQESLSLLDPAAVLFHRCKDSSLINRLREKKGGDALCLTDTDTKSATAETVSSSEKVCSDAAPTFNPEDAANKKLVAQLQAEIAELRQQQIEHSRRSLEVKLIAPPRKTGKQMKKKRVLTPEHRAKLRESMARARAAKLAKA